MIFFGKNVRKEKNIGNRHFIFLFLHYFPLLLQTEIASFNLLSENALNSDQSSNSVVWWKVNNHHNYTCRSILLKYKREIALSIIAVIYSIVMSFLR